jgi:urocanate hydratase
MSAVPGSDAFPSHVTAFAAESIVPEVSRVYSLFQAFSALAQERFGGELGGRLLLYGAMDADGAALALAGNIAGAATLGIDSVSQRLKQGIRHGFCDFMVNDLDEALRILKNEIRKKQPVSVCLEGDLGSISREIVDRGVQPDVLGFSNESLEAATLLERGSVVLSGVVLPEGSLLDATWEAETAAALWLPKVDALAAEALPAGDARARWLKFAPRYLGRSLAARRYLRMTRSELETFRELLDSAMAAGEIGARITIGS